MADELSATYIREIRGKYGLTQQAFARLLGLGEASVVRYENGQVPSKANANLLRAAANPAFMLECLKRDSGALSREQHEKAERVVYTLVSFGEDGDIVDMDELYEITLQQEILNGQAAQLMGEVSRLRIAAKEAGDAVGEAVYQDVLKQLAFVKPLITYEENSNRVKLAELKGQIECLMRITHERTVKAA